MQLKKNNKTLNLEKNYIKIFHWEEGILEFPVQKSYFSLNKLYSNENKEYYEISINISSKNKNYLTLQDPHISLENYPLKSSECKNLDNIEIKILDDNGDFTNLYIGSHYNIDDNNIKITKKGEQFDLFWSGECDDINYFNEKAQRNRVEIYCSIKFKDK